VFSFHGSKTITTGEGGMVVTDDESVHRRMQFLADHGRNAGDRSFRHSEVAFKYRMTDLQAALGLAQLRRRTEIVDANRQIFRWYEERLAGEAGLRLNAEPDGLRNSYWMTTVIVDPAGGITKEPLAEELARSGITTRPFFYPLSSLPAYRGHDQAGRADTDRPVSAALGRYGLNLPSARCLTEDDVDYVCQTLLAALAPRAGDREAARV
jgi:perosamine synthetase